MSIRRRMRLVLEAGYPVGTVRQWADGERTKQNDGTWTAPGEAARASEDPEAPDEDAAEDADADESAKKGKQKPSHEKRVAMFEAWKNESLEAVRDTMSSMEPLSAAVKDFKKKFGKIEGISNKAERVGGRIYDDAEKEAGDLWDGEDDPPPDIEARQQEIKDQAECMSDALSNLSGSSDIEDVIENLLDQVAELKKQLKKYGKELEGMDSSGCG